MHSDEMRKQAAERFIIGAKLLRESIGVDIPIQQTMILSYLWLNGSAKQIELAQELDLKVAAASRHCRSLSTFYVQEGENIEEKGQQLIIAERNAVKNREMRYSLTDSTRKIMTRFIDALANQA